MESDDVDEGSPSMAGPSKKGSNKEGGPRRVARACQQCRARKQRCAGPSVIPCVRCTAANIECSFENDAKDPRYNPFLAMSSSAIGAQRLSEHLVQNGVNPLASAVNVQTQLDAMARRIAALENHTGLEPESPLGSSGNEQSGFLETKPHLGTPQSLVAGPSSHPYSNNSNPSQSNHHHTHNSNGSTEDQVMGHPPASSAANSNSYSAIAVSRQRLAGASLLNPLGTLRDLDNTPPPGSDRSNPERVEEGLLTPDEVARLFSIFFRHVHPIAPLLDVIHDGSVDFTRRASTFLFLTILSTAARYWGYPINVPPNEIRRDTWYHPAYHQLVALLDAELLRLTVRPVPTDSCVQTVQSFLILAHWMPHDKSATGMGGTRSRFSELSAWNTMGLATRWGIQLGLGRTATTPFLRNDRLASLDELRQYRTLAYLLESDHYLAIIARQPTVLDPRPALAGIHNFLAHPNIQPTDRRIAAMLQLAAATRNAGDMSGDLSFRSLTTDAVKQFNTDLNSIEKSYLEPLMVSYEAASMDQMSLHFPFITMRWYRLALSCSFLSSPSIQAPQELLGLSVNWATQMLGHLSLEAANSRVFLAIEWSDDLLTPNNALVQKLAFSMDQHFVILAYAACFLTLVWYTGCINQDLKIADRQSDSLHSEAYSPLYRLVRLTASTLELTSANSGHTGRSYVSLLEGLANVVQDAMRTDAPSPSGWKEDGANAILDLWSVAGLDDSFKGEIDWVLNKFKVAASKAGVQATAFGQNVAREVQEGSTKTLTSFKLENECTKAAKILQSFLADPAHPESALNAIPKEVLLRARGLAIFTVLKAGFVWSGKAGSGIVIARLEDGTWSAPSCIATGGVGFGLQIGADLSEFIVVLNSQQALQAFAKGGNVTIGGALAAAAGPIGVGGAVNTSLVNPAPVFTYSKSKGLFAGMSLEGTVLIERKDANEAFYGQHIPALDLLTGKVPPPEAASAVYEAIEAAEGIDESGLPDQAYVVPEGTLGGQQPVGGAAPGAKNETMFEVGH